MTDAAPAPAVPAARFDRFETRRTARCAVLGPADPSAARELWIALHGYGQLAERFLAGMRALDDGSRLIVAPEALSRFYDSRTPLEKHAEAAVGASWMTREDRAAEIDDQVRWLQLAHDHYRALVAHDATLTVLGFSQGATAASRLVGLGRVDAAHFIAWGGMIAPELPLDPASALGRTRCSLVVGDRDKYVPDTRLNAELGRLDAAGYRYELVRFEGGHRLDDGTLRRLAAR